MVFFNFSQLSSRSCGCRRWHCPAVPRDVGLRPSGQRVRGPPTMPARKISLRLAIVVTGLSVDCSCSGPRPPLDRASPEVGIDAEIFQYLGARTCLPGRKHGACPPRNQPTECEASKQVPGERVSVQGHRGVLRLGRVGGSTLEHSRARRACAAFWDPRSKPAGFAQALHAACKILHTAPSTRNPRSDRRPGYKAAKTAGSGVRVLARGAVSRIGQTGELSVPEQRSQ